VRRLLIVACVAALVLALGLPADGATLQRVRVLFIGNSLTATNDLPATVAAFARTSNRIRVETRMVAPGGVNLEDHWNFTGARDALEDGPWDVVVLQQGPSALPESQVDLRTWAQRWADEIRAHGAKPALLTVWPESYRQWALRDVIRSYGGAAFASHAAVFPAGVAWQRAWNRNPRLQLYGPDGFHPSPLGTYLAATVVYGALAHGVPTKLPLSLRGVKLTPARAQLLRTAAAEALARNG
jgi:hypothetical protein